MHTIKTIFELPGHPDPVILGSDLNRIHETFEGLAPRYGKMFTVQFVDQPIVVVADSKPINFILDKRPELFGPCQRKNRVLEALRTDGIGASDGNSWQQQRQIVAASIGSTSFLACSFEKIKEVTEDLKNRWIAYEANLSITDIESEILGYSISVFTAIAFGDMAHMPAEKLEKAQNLLKNMLYIFWKRTDALLPQLLLESFSGDNNFDLEVKEIYSVIKNLVEHYRNIVRNNNGAGKTMNLLHGLIEGIEKEGLDILKIKLIENILQITLAAEENTGSTLLRILSCLAVNPQVQKEIQDEVDSILGKRRIIEDIKDIKKLICMDAVIMETMRILSVSRLIFVEAKTDLILEDVEIPGGTPLALLIAYCGLDAENFCQAKVFDHRRWRRESRVKSGPHNSKAALGFGAGPRSCPGRSLAMLVMKTVLAMICANFQIRAVSEKPVSNETISKDWPFSLDFVIETRDNPHNFASSET